MAHVTLKRDGRGAIPRLARRYTRRKFGHVVEPVAAASHHSGVLIAKGAAGGIARAVTPWTYGEEMEST
jgi:hypothetical protein